MKAKHIFLLLAQALLTSFSLYAQGKPDVKLSKIGGYFPDDTLYVSNHRYVLPGKNNDTLCLWPYFESPNHHHQFKGFLYKYKGSYKKTVGDYILFRYSNQNMSAYFASIDYQHGVLRLEANEMDAIQLRNQVIESVELVLKDGTHHAYEVRDPNFMKVLLKNYPFR